MLPIVNDRVAWSVSVSVGLSPSEPFRKFGSDRDTVCVQDSGGSRKRPITNVTASTSLPSFKRQLKHFYLPHLSRHFKLLSHICVPCPRSYLAYATIISTFYYYYYYYYM